MNFILGFEMRDLGCETVLPVECRHRVDDDESKTTIRGVGAEIFNEIARKLLQGVSKGCRRV